MASLRDSKALLSPSARWAEEGNPVPCELTMSRPKSKGRAISFQQSAGDFIHGKDTPPDEKDFETLLQVMQRIEFFSLSSWIFSV